MKAIQELKVIEIISKSLTPFLLLLKIFPEPVFFCHSCVPILGLSWAFHVVTKYYYIINIITLLLLLLLLYYYWLIPKLPRDTVILPKKSILINLYCSSIPPLLPQKIFSDHFDFVICASNACSQNWGPRPLALAFLKAVKLSTGNIF